MATAFMYQTIQVPNHRPMSSGPSSRGAALASGVKLLRKASIALNQWAISYRVNREIEKLTPDISRAMSDFEGGQQCHVDTGVLVVIGIQESEHTDATGLRGQAFLSIHLGGAGSSPNQVLRRYLYQAKIVQGGPRSWRRIDKYLWITRR